MKKYIFILLILIVNISFSQKDYFIISGGIDPKIVLSGTDNEYTKHDRGIDYLGKLGIRFIDGSEFNGYLESYEDIGYRAIGLQYNKSLGFKKLEFLLGTEISIISRKELYDNGLNVIWQEYLPSFGINGETRFNINKTFAIGWIGNLKTRPDLVPYSKWSDYNFGNKIRFSTYLQLYLKI